MGKVRGKVKLKNAVDEALEHLEQRGRGCGNSPFVLALGCCSNTERK